LSGVFDRAAHGCTNDHTVEPGRRRRGPSRAGRLDDSPSSGTREGRAPTRTELLPSVEAAFQSESYAPGQTARIVISNRARGLRLQVFRSGPERIVTRSNSTMHGVRVMRPARIGTSTGRRVVEVSIGDWPSGLYFARLSAEDGRVGFAPFVVRPRRIGKHRVAVVLPTLTWQAYNLHENGDGRATRGTRTGSTRPSASDART
jgi:hypothetical protein